MKEVVWDGIVYPETLSEETNRVRQALADAAKKYDWDTVLSALNSEPTLVNTTRPGGTSLYTPLHQAAHGGAPEKTIQALSRLGAWRTLQNARGERPLDVAEKLGHSHLLGILAPTLKRHVPVGILMKIQSHFHAVIRGRAAKQVGECRLRLPELEPLMEIDENKMWFPVPGMYGGFAYWLEQEGVNAKLVTESWCRVVGGSGQRHEITSAGSNLAAEGFV
jgi:hypothetical protein